MIISKKFVWFLIILIICGLGFLFAEKKGLLSKQNPDLYYAVFLTNGQVYFGNLQSKTKSEIVLNNVYYLQLENEGSVQDQLAESRFTLVKMGNEIHGPKDELFINRDNVLFYETLRDDSRVVESIKQSQN